MQIIEEFRKFIRNELGDLWKIIQREVNEYFNVIDFANIIYRKNYHKLNKPDEDFLNDPLKIPEMYTLLYSIKENNFNFFNDDSNTKNYNHYEHGYFIRDDVLIQLEPIVERIKDFRIENFNKLLKNQKKNKIFKEFINHSFKDYGLTHYEQYINVLNGIAHHKKFYIILPNLLRCLFENLLYDIFQKALDKKHTEFFFLKSQSRARDFSQLIALLNLLKDKDLKPYHKDSINQNIISLLKEIQKNGNLTVHEILKQIDRYFTLQNEEKINRVLLTLLVFFKKIQDQNIEIKDQYTIDKIEKTLKIEKSVEEDKLKSKINKSATHQRDFEEKIIENEKVKELFALIQELIEYLVSKTYWDNEEIKDEKINTKILRMTDNIENLRKYFGFNIINEERGKYDKIITILEGRFILNFRNRNPYESFINKKGRMKGPFRLCNENISSLEIKDLMYKEIRTELKNKFNQKI